VFAASCVNALPVWRKKRVGHALQELREKLLTEPAGFVLFPEGARSRDGSYLPFRAGVEAVPRTQWEASQVLGLSRPQVWRRIIFPQAFRTVAPVYTGYFISIFKATALLSFISLREVFGVARNLAALNFRYIELFTIVMIIYLLMGIPAVLLMRAVERHWRVDRPQEEIVINAALSQS
jgi:hypothetical protein